MIRKSNKNSLKESSLRRMKLRRRLMESRKQNRSLKRRIVEDVEEDDTEEECYFIEQAVYNDIIAACKKYVDPKYGLEVGYIPVMCKRNEQKRSARFEADILNVSDMLEELGRGEVEDIKESVTEAMKDAVKTLKAYREDNGDYEYQITSYYLNRIADILDEPALRPE